MQNKSAFLLIILSFLLSACENTNPQNNSVNLNKTENVSSNQNSVNISGNNDQTANIANNITNSAETADDAADFAGTAGITDKKYNINGAAILKEVRSGQHENYDRAVFEFEGAEMPGYHIEYIDKPVRACGSGKVVPLAGDAWLEIRFYPANAHTEEGKPTIENRERAPNLKIIRELKSTCDFEADVTWVLGVAAPNKYRVLELKNPTRLAVDIKH